MRSHRVRSAAAGLPPGRWKPSCSVSPASSLSTPSRLSSRETCTTGAFRVECPGFPVCTPLAPTNSSNLLCNTAVLARCTEGNWRPYSESVLLLYEEGSAVRYRKPWVMDLAS